MSAEPTSDRLLSDGERARLEFFQGFRQMLIDALRAGKDKVTAELTVFDWMMLCDEVLDRPPRNMSQLIRDDIIDRLHEAIDRLHTEANILVAVGPREKVAAAYDDRPTPPPRQQAQQPMQSRYRPSRPIRASSELEQRMALDRMHKDPPPIRHEREPGEDG